ncbi:MAG: carboxypeptidase regulatory-like domain-containing protein [Planctomycetaceae bacterium]|nr:carboxypeptidase regulatory-like domain-containing protein [Planctomycetaceae bacterium]
MSEHQPPEASEAAPQADPVELKPAPIQIWPMIFGGGGLLFAAGLIWFIIAMLKDDGTLVTVTGRVTMQGQPVENGFIMVASAQGGQSALSAFDADGKFDLATEGAQGVRVGTYKVVVRAFTRAMPPQSTVRSIYTEATTTPLTMKVEKAGVNHFEFDLEAP